MKELIGKTINKVFMDEDCLTFETSDGLVISYAVYGDCCSSSVWYDFYGVADLIGQTITDTKDLHLDEDDWIMKRLSSVDYNVKTPRDFVDDSIQIYGVSLSFVDKWGYERTAVASFRNYSNGYYGGEYILTENGRSNHEITEDVYEAATVESEKRWKR